MNGIEKIKAYIAETKINSSITDRYTIYLSEIHAIYEEAQVDPCKAILTAFKYGRAKGYRAAKAEERKKCK